MYSSKVYMKSILNTCLKKFDTRYRQIFSFVGILKNSHKVPKFNFLLPRIFWQLKQIEQVVLNQVTCFVEVFFLIRKLI